MTRDELINTPVEDISTGAFEDQEPSLHDQPHWRDAGFTMQADGLYFVGPKLTYRVSDRFWCDSRTRDFDGSNHGIKIAWFDADGHRHELNITYQDIASAKKLVARLCGLGLRIEHGCDGEFLWALKSINPRRTSRVVQRVGWHDGKVFVLPNRVIGQINEQVSLDATTAQEDPFAELESLDAWKNGPAAMAIGNSRLIFAISVALSGPLLEPAKAENTTFHIHGVSSIGKTSAARLAATVWGKPRLAGGFIKPWNTTLNALELTARSRCDTCLILDEINMASPKDVASTAYHLSSGTGKARMTSELALAPTAKWRVAALSTGEFSFQDYVGNGGVKVTGGQSVRFPSLPADAGKGMGILEDIHDYSSAGEFIAALHVSCERAYGTAGPAFAQRIAWHADRCADDILRYSSQFVKETLPKDSNAQVERVCDMFGRVAAASALASVEGVVPWTPEEGRHAIAACFNAWLAERRHKGSHELFQGISVLRDAILKRETGEIANWDSCETPAKLGLRRTSPEAQAGIYLHPWAVREILKGYGMEAVLSELKHKGYLIAERGRTTRQARNPHTARNQRFICLKPSFLEDELDLPPPSAVPDNDG